MNFVCELKNLLYNLHFLEKASVSSLLNYTNVVKVLSFVPYRRTSSFEFYITTIPSNKAETHDHFTAKIARALAQTSFFVYLSVNRVKQLF